MTCDESLIDRVERGVEQAVGSNSSQGYCKGEALGILNILFYVREECVELVNCYAPEHLMLSVKDYLDWVPEIRNAGSVFLGHYSPESAGIMRLGRITLPTNRYARAYSGGEHGCLYEKDNFQEITRRKVCSIWEKRSK